MTGRRDFLIGAGCVVGAGSAWTMTPRRHVSLLGGRSLSGIIPRAFGTWSSTDTTDLVAPTEPGSLASRIYGSTVARIYRDTATGDQVMALIAHGEVQSDDLMLHRPEICYPAFGFSITASRPIEIPIASGIELPARTIVARASGRTENVLYWTRLGEFFPQNRKAQQIDRLRTALEGEIGDGVLFRLSQDTEDSAWSFGSMAGFAATLLKAMAPANRAALIGTARAKTLSAA